MEANARSVDFLIAAKAIYGLGIGFAMHGAPVYIAETAPSSLRGTLISLKEAAIVFGILCGYFCASQYVGESGVSAARRAAAASRSDGRRSRCPLWELASAPTRTARSASSTGRACTPASTLACRRARQTWCAILRLT